MALAQLLGSLGSSLGPVGGPRALPQPIPSIDPDMGMGSPMPSAPSRMAGFLGDVSGIINSAAQQRGGMPQQAMPAPQQEQRRGGIFSFLGGNEDGGTRDTLGRIGDFLLQANGLPQMYAPRRAQRQQRQISEALSRYIGATNPELAEIAGLDTDLGLGLLKAAQDAQPQSLKPTSFIQEAEWLGLSPEQARGIWEENKTRPVQIVGSPATGYFAVDDEGGGFAPSGGDLPRVSSPQEAMALPPGTQFMMPDGRIGTVPGGGGGNATGGF